MVIFCLYFAEEIPRRRRRNNNAILSCSSTEGLTGNTSIDEHSKDAVLLSDNQSLHQINKGPIGENLTFSLHGDDRINSSTVYGKDASVGASPISSSSIFSSSHLEKKKDNSNAKETSSEQILNMRSILKKTEGGESCFMASKRESGKIGGGNVENNYGKFSFDESHLDDLTNQAKQLKVRAENLSSGGNNDENNVPNQEKKTPEIIRDKEYLSFKKRASSLEEMSANSMNLRRLKIEQGFDYECLEPKHNTQVAFDDNIEFGNVKKRVGSMFTATRSEDSSVNVNPNIKRRFSKPDDLTGSHGILKNSISRKNSLDLQEKGDPRPILKKKVSSTEEEYPCSVVDPMKSILKKKYVPEDELENEPPRSILKSGGGRSPVGSSHENLIERQDSRNGAQTPIAPILKKCSSLKESSTLNQFDQDSLPCSSSSTELRPILKRRETVDNIKPSPVSKSDSVLGVSSNLVSNSSSQHKIQKRRSEENWVKPLNERPLSVADRVAGMEAIPSQLPGDSTPAYAKSKPTGKMDLRESFGASYASDRYVFDIISYISRDLDSCSFIFFFSNVFLFFYVIFFYCGNLLVYKYKKFPISFTI